MSITFEDFTDRGDGFYTRLVTPATETNEARYELVRVDGVGLGSFSEAELEQELVRLSTAANLPPETGYTLEEFLTSQEERQLEEQAANPAVVQPNGPVLASGTDPSKLSEEQVENATMTTAQHIGEAEVQAKPRARATRSRVSTPRL